MLQILLKIKIRHFKFIQDWLQNETKMILKEQVNFNKKTHQEAEDFIIELIKERLRPFALEHGIIIAKGIKVILFHYQPKKILLKVEFCKRRSRIRS